jgi:hypothetical protein
MGYVRSDMLLWRILVLILAAIWSINARRVLELQGVNFELALTSYKYVAVLFYDKTTRGQSLLKAWLAASEELDDLSSEAELAMVANLTEPSLSC